VKILLVHNYYQQPGGEDQVFRAESQLLREAKHEVLVYEKGNEEIKTYTSLEKISLVGKTVWSRESQKEIERLLQIHHPDLVHFHNTFPLISPSAYYSCKRNGAGVIQTLHNFRNLCPNALFFRDGRACEDCLGKPFPWPGIVHACYRKSRLQTATVCAMVTSHRMIGTLENKVDRFIALSQFSREKFIQGGLPPEKIIVKPNFVFPDPGQKNGDGEYILYVGRMSPEKGIRTLLSAIQKVAEIPVRIVGDGPLLDETVKFAKESNLHRVQFLGRVSKQETIDQMKQARALVFPSECYENFPLVIAEAFACGLPVVATRLGAIEELIREGETGLLYSVADTDELAAAVLDVWSNPERATRMGKAARREFENRFTADINLKQILQIYQSVLQ
jgi:glycosyltransferase involved in cell wall biosynthesis